MNEDRLVRALKDALPGVHSWFSEEQLSAAVAAVLHAAHVHPAGKPVRLARMRAAMNRVTDHR